MDNKINSTNTDLATSTNLKKVIPLKPEEAIQMLQEKKIDLKTIDISGKEVLTFKDLDGKSYRSELSNEQAKLFAKEVKTQLPYASDSKGFQRTALFSEMDNFAHTPDRTTLTISAGANAGSSEAFMDLGELTSSEGIPEHDLSANATADISLKLDSKYFGIIVGTSGGANASTSGLADAQSLYQDADAINKQYQEYSAAGDTAAVLGMIPQVDSLIARANALEANLKAQGQMTIDTSLIGRIPLPDLGPFKDMSVSAKANFHFIPGSPEAINDPGKSAFPRFEYLMGDLQYSANMNDLNLGGLVGGEANLNQSLVSTKATAPFGGGFGLGIGGRVTDYLRWGFSADNIAGYIPGKQEVWSKKDNVAASGYSFQPTSGFSKESERDMNVYSTFKVPTYRLTLNGLIPQTGTQIMFSETIKDSAVPKSATFVGVQQPLGPVDVGAGYTYNTGLASPHLFSAGMGVHVTRDNSLRMSGYTDSFDPNQAKSVGANLTWETRF